MRYSRRRFAQSLLAGSCGAVGMCVAGCVPQSDTALQPDLVWGRRGISEGRLLKPRAVAVSPANELYVVDMTGRIQVFDADGNYLRGWRTPEIKQGKPTGLGWGQDNRLLVADTHYYRVLFYEPSGERVEDIQIGGTNGDEPGQFHFVTDVAQDARGHYFVGQYGQIDRIQEFDKEGQFVKRWGSQGNQLGEFSRPQGLIVDEDNLLWVADACNHRIQIFDVDGAEARLVRHWGAPGKAAGQLQYPYGIDFDHDGTVLIAEWGNHRIQRFDRHGNSLDSWGGPGKEDGQFVSPWALIVDADRKLHVLDSMNHRLQRFALG